MKQISYLFAVVLLLTLSAFPVNAQQENETPFDLSLDLMSRYVWRGTDFGGSPSIQPGFSYSVSGLTIGTWGAYTVNNPGAQELDLYLSYAFLDDMFSVTITDYFFPNELAVNDHYFDYRDEHTGHVFEASLAFNGTEKLPLGVLVATNVYGADARRLNDDGSMAGNQYSTYAELSYSFSFIDVFAGMNLTSPDTDLGETGFYGDKAGFVNIGCTVYKDIRVSETFSMPLFVSLITNPLTEKIFLVAGLSF